LQQSGAVKVGYSDDGTSLGLDLLNALRSGEIISIQGDCVVGGLARETVRFFGREVFLPAGPSVLALAAEASIYPLFIARTWASKIQNYRPESDRFLTQRPTATRADRGSDEQWAHVLEGVVR
jgi:lauroyl/myristoyl acyltransferase